MIEEDIRNFDKQFSWEPEIKNQGSTFLQIQGRTLGASVLGMGGSHLGGDLLNAYDSKLGLVIHSDYGLPINISTDDLIIASSYSGNTEEVIDGLNLALEKGLKVAVLASGGKLLEIAKEKSLPYIQLPADLQPRMSAGYQVKALAKVLGQEDILEELSRLAQKLNPSEFEERGRELAEKIGNKIPVVYASQNNYTLAYTWKIRFNETAKIPAFYNLFPEANHNEMSGFIGVDKSEIYPLENSRAISRGSRVDGISDLSFIFLLLADSEDHPRIQKRMEIFSKLFTDKGFSVEQTALTGEGRFHRLFSNLLLADWTSYYLAKQKGIDPEQIPLVEEFKRLMNG